MSSIQFSSEDGVLVVSWRDVDEETEQLLAEFDYRQRLKSSAAHRLEQDF